MSALDFSHIPPDQLGKFLEGPALEPPPGVVPNFQHPENHNAPGVFVCIFGLVVSTLVLFARFYARFFYLKKGHVVDFMAFSAYVFFLAIVVGSLQASRPGLFAHQWDIQAKNLKIGLYTIFIGINFYGAGMLLLKSAILWEWLRIFSPGQRNYFFWNCTIMLALNIIFYTTTIILSVLSCQPLKRTWDKTVPGHCIDATIINIASAAVNFALDISILLLPQRVIWALNMPKKKRRQVSMLFAVGISACIFAAARIVSSVIWHKSNDTVYNFSFISTWAILEFTCGFTIFGIPAVPKLLSVLKISAWILSLRSWARSTTQALWSNKSSSSWKAPSRTYRTISDAGPPPLQLNSLGPSATVWQKEAEGIARPQDQVVRTVEFIATESSESQAHAIHQEQLKQAWYLNDGVRSNVTQKDS
ncbi:hypothetical protein F4824DRAFT_475241 [Ustulina deusta]|nr:hypothetical protein F4824DRAFT_475241 [Ustulina deusta]